MGPPLSLEDKVQILVSQAEGKTMRTIAREVKCSLGTVAGTVKKWKGSRSIQTNKPLPRHHFFTPTKNRKLRDLVRRHRQWTTRRLAARFKEKWNLITSMSTVGRERRRQLFKHVARRIRPWLNPIHKAKRLRYAHDNEGEMWDDIWFSDEKQFRVDVHSGKVWKQPWEAPIIGFQGPRTISVLVWGAISWDGKTTLHTSTQPFDSDAYINILDKHLIQQQPDSFHRLLQDNASPHVSKFTLDYLKNFDVELVQNYPPYSPELNPIEHVWSWMVSYVNQDTPFCLSDLKIKVREAWDAIPQKTLKRYIGHVSTVCNQIIEANGGTIIG